MKQFFNKYFHEYSIVFLALGTHYFPYQFHPQNYAQIEKEEGKAQEDNLKHHQPILINRNGICYSHIQIPKTSFG